MAQTPMPGASPQGHLSTKLKFIIGGVAILGVLIAAAVIADKQKNEEAAMGAKEQLESQMAKKSEFEMEEQKNAPTADELPPVEKTSNIDAVADGITADMAGDAAVAAEGDEDIDYLNESESSMDSEGVYNESEF